MAGPLTSYPILQKVLPDTYEYRICKFENYTEESDSQMDSKQETETPSPKFEATIRLKLRTKTEAKLWIKDMEQTSAVTWRVDKTYPVCGGKKTQNIYRIDLRCQHRTYARSSTAPKKPSSKNTSCPAKMFLVVKRTHMASGKISQSTDEFLQEFPTRVYLDFRHNHHLLSPECLAKRDVSEETIRKLTNLYIAGHTPLSALEEIKRDLQADYGDQFVFVSADRSKCPDKQFCYRLYYKLFYPKYPKSPGKKKLLELEKYLKPYCEKYELHCASIEQTEDDSIIIAICTPQNQKIQNENSIESENQSLCHSVHQPLSTESYPPPLHFLEQFHNPDTDEVQSETISQCQEGLRAVFDSLISKVESNPGHFLRPIEEFIRTCQVIKKDQELMTALEGFGQHSGIITAVNRTMKRQHSQDKLDKTAIICAKRRKGSRRQLITARPFSQHQSPTDSQTLASVQTHTTQYTSSSDHQVPSHHMQTHEVCTHTVATHKMHTLNIKTSDIQTIDLRTQNFDIHEAHSAAEAENDVHHETLPHDEVPIVHEVGEQDLAGVEEVHEPHHQSVCHHTHHHQIQLHHPHPHLTICTSKT